ncbi:MAG: protein kinase [Gammaproteobacteria bacterium]|nr:protein kinase [Gammaproteobacteria bacterium]
MKIPGYKIERLIGKGGMSTVYLAVQESLDRRVALKVLKKFDDPKQAARFLHEGRIIASLSHRNIITIHDIGTIGDRLFIAMEYLDGRSLSERIEEGVPLAKTLSLMEQMAACLHFVHRRGIIHRDIKPSNILFHSDGTPKLTDFGIAKQLDSDQEITHEGAALGSPYYLSPEQAEGLPLDGRADIYALGIVFYQMLTGQRPYARANAVETIVAHLTQPLPVLPEAFADYQDLLEAMIAKRPGDRVASAKELAYRFRDAKKALAAGDDSTGTHPAPLRPRARRRHALTWLTVVLVIGGLGVYLLGTPPSAPTLPVARVVASDTPVVAAATADVAEGSPTVAAADDTPTGADIASTEPSATTAAEPEAPLPVAAEMAEEATPADIELPDAAQPTAAGSLALVTSVEPEPTVVRADAPDDIDVLLQSAARAIEQLRLTRPEGDNAYDYYHQVLAIDPGNAAANAGMDDIAARYTRMAQSALDDGNTARASRYIERGLGVQPADATLQALRDEITRREQQQALAAAEAERKAAETPPAVPDRAAEDTLRGQPGTGHIVDDFKRVWRAVFD